jgi:mannose-1-phosphate guanylyltransferase / phosphomannomutase
VPFSQVVAGLPKPTLIHRVVQCPWALKGAVMRGLNERYADADVDLTDGIKIFFEERGWVQVLPDQDEPLIHVYAEGDSSDESERLADELRSLLAQAIDGEPIGVASTNLK